MGLIGFRGNRLYCAVTAVMLSASASSAMAIDELLIIGTRDDARAIAGSGSVIDSDQIRLEAATDINQLLKTVPGIYIREEDGLGLRPNIGIRGATSERSSKITVMEDGIMMAPAPYAAPAAYYFPTTTRQSAVEVLKGAPLLRYGPQTTGGVLNLVSTPIPEQNSGRVSVMLDERAGMDLHGWYGAQAGDFGVLLETVQRDGSGFKSVDRYNDRGDFTVEDYVAKLGWQSSEGPEQNLLVKVQYSEESSQETYLGLTDADFAANSNRRYGVSAIDQMDNRHTGLQLSYSIALSERLTLSSNLYQNNFKRNWFKLDGGNGYITAANNGDADAQAVLDGTRDVDGLLYKNNNRRYESRGVEINLALDLNDHEIDVGARVHEDEADRFQPIDRFNQVAGYLYYSDTIQPNASNNRIAQAEATTFWATDAWQVNDRLMITSALRYEDIDSAERRYADLDRTALSRTTGNSTQEWLPGVSFTYDLGDNLQVLAGVHKGFSPLGGGAVANEEPETSTNWEGGLRYGQNNTFVEAIAFHSDFSDKTENCSVGSPCSNGDNSGTYRTGEAIIQGIEFQFSTAVQLNGFNSTAATVPFDINYTWTKAEVSQDNAVSGVLEGDLLKDVPENVFSVRTGVEFSNGYSNYLVAKYVDELCTTISCNRNNSPFAATESVFVTDFISRYTVNDNLEMFLKVENLFDSERIVSRSPQGARPNKPRTASLGLVYQM